MFNGYSIVVPVFLFRQGRQWPNLLSPIKGDNFESRPERLKRRMDFNGTRVNILGPQKTVKVR